MPFANPPLKGRIAFVSGSTRGIGKAIALELAAWGADVAVHGMKSAEAAEAVAAAGAPSPCSPTCGTAPP